MAADTLHLTANATRGLAEITRAVEKANQKEPIEVRLSGGAPPVKGEEIVVMVFGARKALACRRNVGGKTLKLRELGLWMESADRAIQELASAPASEAPQLTSSEAALLDEAGLTEGDRTRPGAFERSRIDFDLFLQRESLTLEQAAKALGVSTARLRQRLSPDKRTLYGVKDGRAWRIPKFQFDRKGKQVRGIGKVFPHIRPDAHPLSVRAWFTIPHQDLVVGGDDDGRPVPPVEWLSSGRPVVTVAELAKEI
jgi:hypothetical protein